MEMKSFMPLYAIKIMFYYVNIACYQYHFHFLKFWFKHKFYQVNPSIKVNRVLIGSTSSLHYTWFHTFFIVSSEL